MLRLDEGMLTPISIQLEKLDLCLQMWQLILHYIQKSPDSTIIEVVSVQKKLQGLGAADCNPKAASGLC